MFATNAMAADGTITITGLIQATTCAVGVNGTASGDATVALPTVANTSLAAANAKAGLTPFTIKLTGASCTNGAAAKATFDGGDINYATGRLTNGAGTASLVEVGLVNGDGTDITIGDLTTIKGATIASNAATLGYGAQYVATGAATAGTVNSKVTYSIVYN